MWNDNMYFPGIKTCILTNNWANDTGKKFKSLPFPHLLHYFDEEFESCKLGLCKPDPNIYKLVCSKMNVKPSEVSIYMYIYFKIHLQNNLSNLNAVFTTQSSLNLLQPISLRFISYMYFFSWLISPNSGLGKDGLPKHWSWIWYIHLLLLVTLVV